MAFDAVLSTAASDDGLAAFFAFFLKAVPAPAPAFDVFVERRGDALVKAFAEPFVDTRTFLPAEGFLPVLACVIEFFGYIELVGARVHVQAREARIMYVDS